jgi:hypothetical protein
MRPNNDTADRYANPLVASVLERAYERRSKRIAASRSTCSRSSCFVDFAFSAGCGLSTPKQHHATLMRSPLARDRRPAEASFVACQPPLTSRLPPPGTIRAMEMPSWQHLAVCRRSFSSPSQWHR